jgi:hypothetical protein
MNSVNRRRVAAVVGAAVVSLSGYLGIAASSAHATTSTVGNYSFTDTNLNGTFRDLNQPLVLTSDHTVALTLTSFDGTTTTTCSGIWTQLGSSISMAFDSTSCGQTWALAADVNTKGLSTPSKPGVLQIGASPGAYTATWYAIRQ